MEASAGSHENLVTACWPFLSYSMAGPEIPWHVRLHASLVKPFSKARW